MNQLIKCPYFIKVSGKRTLVCESSVASETIMRFDSESELKYYHNRYCSTFEYKSCPIARALERSYKENTKFC